jgi:uncharacterized membrane protein
MAVNVRLALFVFAIAAVALFVAFTTTSLPPVVASHFGPNGLADGHMPRSLYLALMLVLVIGAPLIVAYLPYSLARRRSQRLNIPHRSYWLAPEREQATRSFLWQHGLWFAALLALFLGYMHWLVVLANRSTPPHIDTGAVTAGIAMFCGGLGVWLVKLWRRFRLPS